MPPKRERRCCGRSCDSADETVSSLVEPRDTSSLSSISRSEPAITNCSEFCSSDQDLRSSLEPCRTVAQAAREGRMDELRRLLNEGFCTDSPNHDGWMPLHEAANSGCLEALELLLCQDGVDVNWKTYKGESASHLSVPHTDMHCLELLLHHGADVNSVDFMNTTLLHRAAQTGRMDQVELFLKYGADVDALNYLNNTPLLEAVTHNNIAIVEALLAAGANLKLTDHNGFTALFMALEKKHIECVGVILRHCREFGDISVIDQCASDGVSPLFMAAQKGMLDCMQTLLELGADPNVSTTTEPIALPLHAAIEFQHIECVEVLLPLTDRRVLERCSINPFYYPLSGGGGSPMLKCLVDNGLDVNGWYSCNSDPDNYCPKMLEGVRHLLRYSDRRTPLCRVAVNSLQVRYARELLQAGARINPFSSSELPTLLAALDTCRPDMKLPRLLIERGAAVNLYHPSVLGNLTVITCLAKSTALDFVLHAGAEVDSLFQRSRKPSRRMTPADREAAVHATRSILISSMDLVSADDGRYEAGDYEQEYDSPPPQVQFWQILGSARYMLLGKGVSVTQVLLKLLEFSGCVRVSEKLLAYVESDEERKEILAITDSPRSLLHLSRLAVRRRLSPASLLSHSTLCSLPLPNLLIDFVSYH